MASGETPESPRQAKAQGHLRTHQAGRYPWRRKISHIRTHCSLCHSFWKPPSLLDTTWHRAEQEERENVCVVGSTGPCAHWGNPHLPRSPARPTSSRHRWAGAWENLAPLQRDRLILEPRGWAL